jgi:hypothetical protein
MLTSTARGTNKIEGSTCWMRMVLQSRAVLVCHSKKEALMGSVSSDRMYLKSIIMMMS